MEGSSHCPLPSPSSLFLPSPSPLLGHISFPSLSSFQTALQAHESPGPGSYGYWHFSVLPPSDAAQRDHGNAGRE